jgi:hypothetical protein
MSTHLHESVRESLAWPPDQRIAHLHRDRWVDYPRALETLAQLEALLAMPPRTRMPCLLIYGDSGMGKTMIVEKLKRAHPSVYDRARRCMSLDVLMVQMPPKPSEARFYGQILKAIGAPQRAHERLAWVEPVTLGLLHEIKPRMLVVDEVHSLLAGSAREQRVALNLLKFIANDLSCSIVALGTRDAQAVMQTDAQIASRFRPMELPRWQDDDSLARFLRSYEKLLPLKNPSCLGERAMLVPLLERSGGVTGEICALLTVGAERAIRRGDERITRDILDAVSLAGRRH